MAKDQLERRSYRKSPGREYGYDYDPLHNTHRSGSSQSGRLETAAPAERWNTQRETTDHLASRSGLMLAQRPDPRRTRQLMRQSILASKSRSVLPEDDTEQQESDVGPQPFFPEDDQYELDRHDDSMLLANRYRTHNNHLPQPYAPMPLSAPQEDVDTEENGFDEFDPVDPDIGYEDSIDAPMRYPEAPLMEAPTLRPPARRVQEEPQPTVRRQAPVAYDEDDYDDEDDYEDGYYEDEQDSRPARRRSKKKKGLTRRKLLVGLGLAAAGGVAAYELSPKIPQVLHDAGTNIEHQLEDAYNKGIAAGAEAVRKELITSLDNLEGVSLEGAMAAARLTRVAYDVFVSPIVTLAASITGDFLTITLRAFMTGRGWLKNINYDNSTLAAIQTLLESWVKQVNAMPKQLQSITDADLDGAQIYLKGLKQKIATEQAKLNNPQTTPTPKPARTPKP